MDLGARSVRFLKVDVKSKIRSVRISFSQLDPQRNRFSTPPSETGVQGCAPPAKQPCPDPKSAPPPPAFFSSAPPRRRAPCAPRAPEWGALPADEKVPASPGRDPAATSRECQFLNVTSSHLIIFPRRRLRRRSVQFLKSAVKLPAKPVTGFL